MKKPWLWRSVCLGTLLGGALLVSGCPDDAGDEDGNNVDVPEAVCDDGVDNDGDGATDCLDEDCAADPGCQFTTEICDDQADNDRDGDADCDDPDCADDPACQQVDPCEDVVCNSPPEASCDGDTLVSYGAGACADGACTYAETRTDCTKDGQSCVEGACVDVDPLPEVCDDGVDNDGDGATDCLDEDCADDPACQEDLCQGVTCDAPPATACEGDVAVSYADAGTCSEGECSYEATRTDCAANGQACVEGACVDIDLCEGITCDTPPATACQGNVIVSYADAGVCSEGECSYEATRTDCTENGQFCANGACVDINPCEGVTCDAPPATTCIDNQVVTYAQDGVCSDGECAYEATSTACDAPPATACEGNVIVSYQAEGSCAEGACTYTAVRTDCADNGQFCDAGACVDINPCEGITCDAPPATACEGDVVVSYADAGTCSEGECSYEATRTDCAANGQACVEGACVDIDLCQGVVCDLPPASACEDNVAVSYAMMGTCAEGACSYEATRTDCSLSQQICQEGACVAPDPCEGVTCDAPPAAACEDNVAVSYADAGVCAEGECSYEATRTDCAANGQACVEGACVDIDLCQGVVCDLPPASACEDNVAVSYAMMGTCAEGACSYEATRTDCSLTEQLCSNGFCVDVDPCEGVVCDAPPAATCEGSVAVAYDDLGACLDGECSYEATATDCAENGQGCFEGACIDIDPCEGVVCEEPPAPVCEGDLAVVYDDLGACLDGECSYEATATDCAGLNMLCLRGACVPTPEICDNGQDDDGDEATDCEDEDCQGRAFCQPMEVCTRTCEALAQCGELTEVCGAEDIAEFASLCPLSCTDPLLRDFVGELGELSCGEAVPQLLPVLWGRGICVEDCNDGIDNDNNGLVDCAEEVCGEEPRCLAGSCDLTLPITDFTNTGDTRVAGHRDHRGTCSREFSGNEDIWTVSFEQATTVCMDTIGSQFDTVLYVRRDDCAEGSEVICNDDVVFPEVYSRVQFETEVGVNYFVFVDGYGEGSLGEYTLNLRFGPCDVEPVDEICDDGIDNDQDGQADCGDADCAGDAACGSCEEPSVIFFEGLHTGSTVNGEDHRSISCALGGGADDIWGVSIGGEEPQQLCVHTEGSGYDTALAVVEGDCFEGLEVACNDDGPGLGTRSLIEFTAQPGTPYFIVVDGFRGTTGAYNLWVSVGPCAERARAEICDDGVDNDRDGAVDCDDEGCFNFEACAEARACEEACEVLAACPELAEACSAEDRDFFGQICPDVSCVQQRDVVLALAQLSCEESSVSVLGGLNNAGLCLEGSEICDDGQDNDGDGAIDCDDEQCAGHVTCLPEAICDNPEIILSSGPLPGNTNDASNNQLGSCGGNGAEDVWSVYFGNPGTVCLETVNADFDTVLYVRRDDCQGDNELACNDDANGRLLSQVQFEVEPEVPYYIYVDGFDATQSGAYDLNLRFGPCDAQVEPEICDDGQDNDRDGVADCDDVDCLNTPACNAGTCESPLIINGLGTFTGSTVGAEDLYTPSCQTADGPEDVWFIALPEGFNSQICATTVGTSYDTVLFVREGFCENAEDEVTCDDDTFGVQSQVEFTAQGGVPYFLFVDGFNNRTGDYNLNVSLGACPPLP